MPQTQNKIKCSKFNCFVIPIITPCSHMYYTDKGLSQFRLRNMQFNNLFLCNTNLHKKIPEKIQVKSFYVQKKKKKLKLVSWSQKWISGIWQAVKRLLNVQFSIMVLTESRVLLSANSFKWWGSNHLLFLLWKTVMSHLACIQQCCFEKSKISFA